MNKVHLPFFIQTRKCQSDYNKTKVNVQITEHKPVFLCWAFKYKVIILFHLPIFIFTVQVFKENSYLIWTNGRIKREWAPILTRQVPNGQECVLWQTCLVQLRSNVQFFVQFTSIIPLYSSPTLPNSIIPPPPSAIGRFFDIPVVNDESKFLY